MAEHVARADYWDAAYRNRGVTGVSWYQREPRVSVDLIHLLGVGPTEAVIDIGGGASSLVDHLVDEGFADLSVLDVSRVALDEGRRRIGDTGMVHWVHADVLSWRPSRRFGLWHDRALFHFLTEPGDRATYLEALAEGVGLGGALIMATFAEDGPEQCSGLPVARYSAQDLVRALAPRFEVADVRRELHTTPAGAVQPFTWVTARATG